MNKIVIIDGNSLLFRAYYATAYPGVEIMRSQDGTPTNAIFAFSNMISKIVNSLKPGESIIVAFDAAKHNFRHDALATYKANRKPAPEDLVKQFPLARDFLRAFGIFQFEEEGFEGDDIAGTVAKLAEKEGYEVNLYTSDRDFLQLVDDKITVHVLRKGLSDVLDMTPELVKETYGFEPLQIIDYKGLRGDSSDNLPGIPGIGEKTAVKLIQDYSSFDNIIAHVDEIKGKVGESIKANAEQGRLCRDLAIIKTDIELPFTLTDTIYQGYNFSTINEFCQKYGLKQFINKLNQKWKKTDINEINLEIQNVKSFKDINLQKEIGIALDYEDAEHYHNSDVYAIYIDDANGHYSISLDDAKKDETLLNILKDPAYKKYCFDYKAIRVCLSTHNIEINGVAFDILIASYLLDSSLKNNDHQVFNLYGCDLGKEEEISLFSEGNPSKTAKIAYFSRTLFGKVNAELVKINALELFNELEIPLIDTLADMEIEGFPLDATTLDSFGDIYKAKADALANEIYEMAGEKFNLSSPKQIGEILFNKLGLPDNKKMSTSVDSLKELISLHPIVEKILEYRKYFKLISTYIEGLKPHIYKDGKLHATFNQALTTTGRLSSSNPNLQNISVRDEEGKQIRKAFFYKEDNVLILSLDYSQIELRILAHISNCQGLKEIFEEDLDIHTATAKKVFKLTSEPTSAQRRKAKAVNFGIIYGISDWGLADQLEISVKEARDIINSFYDTFPEVRDFFNNVITEATKNGYVSTLLGRRRYLRELHDSNYQTREFAKRAAMNAPIQGSAADLIKMAMNKVNSELKRNNLQSKLVLQIHDELILKVYDNEKDKVYKLVKETMESAMELSVPLKVDGGFGKSWFEAK